MVLRSTIKLFLISQFLNLGMSLIQINLISIKVNTIIEIINKWFMSNGKLIIKVIVISYNFIYIFITILFN